MKHLLRTVLIIGLSIFYISVSGQNITNYPIPQNPDTLRILGIGNSFTDDGMMYLPDLLEAAGIKNVILGRLYIGGCTLERHCREYEGDVPAYVYYKSTDNKWETVSQKATLTQGISDEKWDIVVLQQASGSSGIYQSYQPWLDKLIEIVRLHCNNAGACIAWQQTWAYSTGSNHGEFPRYYKSQEIMYKAIIASTKQLMEDTPIQTIIPSGTTIQNLRETLPGDSLEFTRDGFHLSLTMGRYAAACAWFQALVGPSLRTTIDKNPYRLAGTPNVLTEEQALACQLAARRACIRMFSAWTEE
ncbi:MAG: DUF4886 domain-containing protein [Bacteroidales bacterium]|nr:DUF4886 domain-containing protein [Bacteroidales bacterium]